MQILPGMILGKRRNRFIAAGAATQGITQGSMRDEHLRRISLRPS
jgi:hypothetical protein